MAEDDSGQDKTEAATPRKIDKARQDADVARSRELGTAVSLTLAVGAFYMLGPSAVNTYREFTVDRFAIDREQVFDPMAMPQAMGGAIELMIPVLAPFCVVMLLAAFIAPWLMHGWVWSTKPMKPSLGKINPLKGLKRMFGANAAAELGKALVKFLLLATVAVIVLYGNIGAIAALAHMPLERALPSAFRIVFQMLIALCVVLILIACIDVPWQRFQHAKKLRMTRQQVKEENKETGGNPEIKAKVRSLQQAISQRRMLLDVPKASVIVVNPTHYAVALRYDESLDAPRLVAKGVDHLALRIRELADAADVPVFQAPPLARALYRHAEVGQSIPTELYVAVARVLAYVYGLQAAGTRRDRRPEPPRDLDLPPSMDDRLPPRE